MPIYEYECKACGTRFEKMQQISAEPLTECLNCGKGPIRRVYHPVGVIFKGSGWYITDSRSSTGSSGGEGGNTTSAGDASGSSSAGGDGASTASSEAKAPSSSDD
ncbi:MAG TPA: FmdB family zinc ribbon protein [Chloroflexia bacterium]|nr:FmdB family zinc ribbon protein [Chloroflexia bacterium]